MLPDLFKRLKPLYGKRIDDLWVAYQLGTPQEQRAIEEVLTILAVKRLGVAIGEEKITLDPPSPAVIAGGEYTIGAVSYPGLAPYPFTIRRQDLLRHMFLLGPSGTGKSTLIIGLLRQLLGDGVTFWSVDFKRNYRCLLNDENAGTLLVLTVGRDTAPLGVNMLQAPPGVASAEWVEALTDIISSAYLLMQGARNVLKEALLGAIAARRERATLRDALSLLTQELAGARSGSRRYGWLESSYRSIEELTKGGIGESLNATNGSTLSDLLLVPVVFELQALGDDQKRCFCLYLLQWVLLLRKHQREQREVLRHVLVFDEAHNVFPKEQWGELGIPSRLAREVREYGEGIIAATQQADVADSLIANSGIKIILRTDYPKDVEFASRLLQIDARWLAKIPLGQGIARLPTRYYQPFLFSFPEQPLKNQLVTDDLVRERSTQWHGTTTPPVVAVEMEQPAKTAPLGAITERERTLLLDIATRPISTTTERYARLGWNPRTGNTTKDSLLRQGLAVFETIDVPPGRVKLLGLTPAGEGVVQGAGGSVQRSGRASLEHEFWRARIKERCEKRGYTVTEEYGVGNGKRADLLATRNNQRLLIEIETGQSDVLGNARSCAASGIPVVAVFTSSRERNKYHEQLKGLALALGPEDLKELHELLQ
jgi:hypothetical protein